MTYLVGWTTHCYALNSTSIRIALSNNFDLYLDYVMIDWCLTSTLLAVFQLCRGVYVF